MMNELNQFVISRILGSTMKHAKRPTFGPLGTLHAQNQVLAQFPKRGEHITFAPETDKIIVRAFEETRDGFPVDRVLADAALAEKFLRRCRQLKVLAPKHAIALRLLGIRKSPRKNLKIRKSWATEPKRDFSKYLFAAEMAITQIKYRYGASVDDILAYSQIGKEFDNLAERLYPGLTPLDHRLAALHVRKSRYCKPDERSLFDSIKTSRADKTMTRHDSLDKIDLDAFRHVNAIVGFVEESRIQRFLYITEAKD